MYQKLFQKTKIELLTVTFQIFIELHWKWKII